MYVKIDIILILVFNNSEVTTDIMDNKMISLTNNYIFGTVQTIDEVNQLKIT